MVLSLPIPSFSRTSASPSRPADSTTPAPQARRHRGSTSTTSSTGSSSSRNNVWKFSSSGGQSASSAPNATSLTLSEALRNNPFGSTSRSHSIQFSVQEAEEQKQEQNELNAALEILAWIFPDVQIEVFRELLVRFDGESRLQVCVEQLLRHKKAWVAGRWNVPDGNEKGEKHAMDDREAIQHQRVENRQGNSAIEESLVPPEERFRSEEYKAAVRAALSREFSSLSRSIVEGVLAEANFSYARARPILRDLSRRTWRATLTNVLPLFRRKKDKEEHPLLMWQRYIDGELAPRLKETGSTELDEELHTAVLAPLLQQRREEQESEDFQIASALNEKQARAANALYECKCCFADVTFEEISTCSASAHIICYHCIQRTLSEALFGQGWSNSVDLEYSTLRCIAPLASGACEGCLHPQVVRQAILLGTAGGETFRKFEDRLASEALLKSQLKLVRCPSCSYAEADPVYHPPSRGICWRVRRDGGLFSMIVVAVLLLDLFPFFMIPLLIIVILDASFVSSSFQNALRRLCLKNYSKRFACANPSCQRVSCLTCQKPWRDPHICHEPLLTDLRATVEAARTAAVKRTCPRCGLSFIKSSGCNKLTCVCGYSMCYLCRKALGTPVRPAQRRGARRPRQRRVGLFDGPDNDLDDANMDILDDDNPFEDDDFEEPEGYKHFCEHFRINPGSRCTECSKCDLYQAEDEEAVARKAGEKAEREWRLRHEGSSTNTQVPSTSLHNINEDLSAGTPNSLSSRRASTTLWDMHFPDPNRSWRYWLRDVWVDGRWRLEGQVLIDWLVDRAIVVEGF